MCKDTVRIRIMLRFAVLIVLLHSCYAESSVLNRMLEDRIMGGWPARISEYPFILSFETRNKALYSQFCGASIISHSWAVTAGHCVNGIVSLKNVCFRAGSTYRENGGEIHDISEVIVHPNYTEGRDYDLAVVKVSNPFRYNHDVQSIALARTAPPTGTPAVALGWGTIQFQGPKPYQLHQVAVNITDHDLCNQQYRNISDVTNRMLCANVPLGGKDACQGDSGGPLVARGELVGIVSWGGVCGDKHHPGVYTDVAFFSSWISSKIGDQ